MDPTPGYTEPRTRNAIDALQEYSLNAMQYRYSFTMLPYTPISGRLDELVQR